MSEISNIANRGDRVTLISTISYTVTIDLKGDDDIILPAKGKAEGILASEIISIPKGVHKVNKS
ncbi:hypothetical protein ThvES_00008230 [Thiovulum sp. ES]|nr:hypothetical protein ThvES_00008230 [Thiovulum sp. ES]